MKSAAWNQNLTLRSQYLVFDHNFRKQILVEVIQIAL